MKPVDLRSDTVTRPTPEMMQAMMAAPVGDDVLGDDPTVTALELKSAKLVGKEAAVFVPSGTMGNQIGIACGTERGDSILAEDNAHVLFYEVGGPAIIAGVVMRTVPSTNGVMDPADVEARIMHRSLHTPGTSLICVENTHNRGGGTITPVATMKELKNVAERHGAALHLDGARVFNASVALGVHVREITDCADSVSFCLSKGLRAPVGSVLAGSQAFIDKARVWRKRLGGGMRQSGLLAAAGIYALDHNIDRLADDHRRTRELAEFLAGIPAFKIEMEAVQTNILMVGTPSPAAEWADRLHERGIWAMPFAENRLRLVFHADVDDEGLARTKQAFSSLAKA